MRLTGWKTALYRALQWTWGFPQTLIGAALLLKHRHCPREEYHGALVTKWRSKGSVSLGMFVFVTDDPFFFYEKQRARYAEPAFARMLLVHEYGHTVQSLLLGPLYLIAVGLPSLL